MLGLLKKVNVDVPFITVLFCESLTELTPVDNTWNIKNEWKSFGYYDFLFSKVQLNNT